MKKILSSLFLCFYILGFSQEQNGPIYFPQEKIISPDCSSSSNSSDCLKEEIRRTLTEVLNKKAGKFEVNKDSLRVTIRFKVTEDGDVLKETIRIYANNDKVDAKINKPLNSLVQDLPKFTVRNYKSEPYRATHYFDYHFKKSSKKEPFSAIPNKGHPYEGGDIAEPPVFPGCEGLKGQESLACFNTMMQRHTKSHFKYPKEALQQKLQGKAKVKFVINKKGQIEKIKTFGKYQLFKDEAKRIVNLLPVFKPGLSNGEPERVPFSFPLTFALNKETKIKKFDGID